MNALPRCTIVSVGLLLLAGSGDVRSDERESATRAAEALQVTTEAARAYGFALAGDDRRELTFNPDSILRWSNPVAGEVFGSVFVWIHEGRPEVIGSLHQWYSPLTHSSHEFHSLAASPIRGSRDGKVVWNSDQAGIELRRLPNENLVSDRQTVADTPITRLRQMREISRRFTVQKTDREEVTREMRLLAQPIYRYPGDGLQILAGAVFVFVQGTDPEVFLLVEARRNNDKWEWQYAFARMNSVRFVAKYQNREVWTVDTWPWSKTKNGREPYTQFGPFNRTGAND